MKKLSFTVGIPTCYGGASLVEVIRSLRSSVGVGEFNIVVVADTVPISKKILKSLVANGVHVIENDVRSSQIAKIKQMRALCETDIFVSTQDDVRFEPNALREIISAFESDVSLTMAGATVLPEPPTRLIEKVVQIGDYLALNIGKGWNDGQNYLLSNGRCLAYRTRFFKQFRIPDSLVNVDGYFYFENKRLGGTFRPLNNAIVYNKSPLLLREHSNQSNRFVFSYKELLPHFDEQLRHEYVFPAKVGIMALLLMLWNKPGYTLLYLLLKLYTRLSKYINTSYIDALWKADITTKRIN